jgi:hypothetical protein
MKLKTKLIRSSIVFAVILPFSANAAINVFSGTTSNLSPEFPYIAVNGDLTDPFFTSSQAQVYAEIDDVANTFKVSNLSVTVASTTQFYSKSVTVGLGQTKEFDIELTLRGFSFQSSDLVESLLTPESGGFFSVETTGLLYPFTTDPIIFDYTITGPTETVSGTSSALPVSELLVNYFGSSTLIDTNNYPNSIVLGDLFYSLRYGSDFTIFDETVDGAGLDMSVIGGGNQLHNEDSNIVLTSVPEPSSFALIVGSFALLTFGASRRRS